VGRGHVYLRHGRHAEAAKLFKQGRDLGVPYRREATPILELGLDASKKATTCSHIVKAPLGSKVQIVGLTSPQGQGLNGSIGLVVSHDPKPGRIGVKVATGVLKAIKPQNMIWLEDYRSLLADEDRDEFEREALTAQRAIEASLSDVQALSDHMPGERQINAQVSEALLRSSAHASTQQVLLITFSRKADAFRTALRKDERLAGCRHALEERELASELDSGAKVLVRPEQYRPLMQVIRMSHFKFASWHLFFGPLLGGHCRRYRQQRECRAAEKEKVLREKHQDSAVVICCSCGGDGLRSHCVQDFHRD
jgi:hypothetical protein